MAFEDLTHKQQIFVAEYVKDGNGTRAAREAGYSEKTAEVIASENLRKPLVKGEIDRIKAEKLQKLGVDADWLLRELVLQYQTAVDADRPQIAMKALDLIGKHCDVGAFKDRLELSGSLHMSHEAALRELE